MAVLTPDEIDVVTRDLHFDWSGLDDITIGQLTVLAKRLRRAFMNHKPVEESELIQSMRKSLSIVLDAVREDIQGRDYEPRS